MRSVKIPDELNRPACVAWWYVIDTLKACEDAGMDYDFMCFLTELNRAYPDEREFILACTRGEV